MGARWPSQVADATTEVLDVTNVLDLHRIATDSEYCSALDELEQLIDIPGPQRSSRAQELAELIAEYEARSTGVLVRALKTRVPAN